MDNTLAHKDFHSRVVLGKEVESQILNALRQNGFPVESPTRHEDMKDKIDGWFMANGKRNSLQIKHRENGDDIIFEIVKDWDEGVYGRDWLSKADYYLVVDRSGNGYLFLTQPIKVLAHTMFDLAQKSPSTQTNWDGKGWQLKMTVDKSSGNTKLMAYMQPSLFHAIKTWNKLI